MKNLFVIILLLMVSGCDNNDSSGPNGNVPVTPIVEDSQWGKLECQKKLDCSNPVLNLDYRELHDFLSLQFPQEIQKNNDLPLEFSCGIRFIELWLQEFPQHSGGSFQDLTSIAQFGRQIINLKKCTNQPDVTKQMENFLTNTEEYKNEI